MLYGLSGFCPNSYARQEPPSAVARRTRLRAQSPGRSGYPPPVGGDLGTLCEFAGVQWSHRGILRNGTEAVPYN